MQVLTPVHLHAGHVGQGTACYILPCSILETEVLVSWVQGQLQVQQPVSKAAVQPGDTVQHQPSMHPSADQQLTAGADTNTASAGAQEPAEGAEVVQAGQP